jgi:hypothetical protein
LARLAQGPYKRLTNEQENEEAKRPSQPEPRVGGYLPVARAGLVLGAVPANAVPHPPARLSRTEVAVGGLALLAASSRRICSF